LRRQPQLGRQLRNAPAFAVLGAQHRQPSVNVESVAILELPHQLGDLVHRVNVPAELRQDGLCADGKPVGRMGIHEPAPDFALVLMMIGVYGIIFEFMNPGSLAPGVIGAICLTLGLYSLNQLPLDYAGLALLLFGIAFMVAEAITPSFGILGFGGLVAFVLGSAMLIDTDAPGYQISWWLIATMAALSGAVLVLLLGVTWRAYRRAPVAGDFELAGAQALVLDWSGGAGHVWVRSERWEARSTAEHREGQTVRVTGADGLTLIVAAIAADDAEHAHQHT